MRPARAEDPLARISGTSRPMPSSVDELWPFFIHNREPSDAKLCFVGVEVRAWSFSHPVDDLYQIASALFHFQVMVIIGKWKFYVSTVYRDERHAVHQSMIEKDV